MESYILPTLEVVMSPKIAKSAIVCMNFSFRGDYLAVSYNNEYRQETQLNKDGKAETVLNQAPEGLGNRDPAFVQIFANRLSAKNPGIQLNSRDPYVPMLKIVLPLADF